MNKEVEFGEGESMRINYLFIATPFIFSSRSLVFGLAFGSNGQFLAEAHQPTGWLNVR
jgi:hypothetical protein